MELTAPIREVKGVGEKTEGLLQNMGVYTVGDILLHFPRDYVKYPRASEINELYDGMTAAVIIRITKPAVMRRTRAMTITVLKCESKDTGFEAIWFRLPYIANGLKKGKTVILYGKVTKKNATFHMEQPALFSPEDYGVIEETMQPVYGLTRGVTNKFLIRTIRNALNSCDSFFDYLPIDIREKYELAEYNYALDQIHFPDSMETLTWARRRLVFDEFFLFLMTMQLQKNGEEKQLNPYHFGPTDKLDEYIGKLPYRLTAAQQRTLSEVISDMKGEVLMQRLVQGDVGSGKTIIAFLAMLYTSDNGCQSAIMAPTEVLAKQHEQSFLELCERFGIEKTIVLLTGSMTAKQKREARAQIAAHPDALIIGTHALIQEAVEYEHLALVITDEQHRFGVRQRETFAGKGQTPHILVMSATPIPRTLAIILYGDMAISVMDEVPATRLPIKNCVVGESYRPKANAFLEKEIAAGHQVYIICPLVEASENYDATNVTDYTEQLKASLSPEVHIACLHGKMKASEKNQIMEDFKDHRIDVLVSTTVIEVGVNVPNATVMMIENADRFGLAQLHQLRGRVGRGSAQSYCIMMNASDSDRAKERLEILNKSNDGFFIASEDLKLRGPGDFFGIRQSGDMSFLIADIYTDAKVLQNASDEVKRILAEDPGLELEKHENLRIKMKEIFEKRDVTLSL
ncbi:MAG: ATP-dependent DNA helicase RecG [bacterium]|nr:ATP-dependent DNA helicase RecG [bacterium]MDY4100284.1 ATP-dependent DNA helicase RecG [Lachnospiraceae bacterium]